jgi:hypothetical protein
MNAPVYSNEETLLDEKEAAEVLGVSKYYMQKHRAEIRPLIPYIRLGANRVRYLRRDLIEFAERLRVNG